MIYQHPLGITPSFDLAIGGVSVNYSSIDRMEISMNEGEHDMLVLHIKGIPAKAITDYIGAPVQLKLTRGSSETQHFIGEVMQITPVSDLNKGAVNRSPFQTAEIYCMGASYKMRSPKSRNWGEQTLIEIASQLADEYGFSLDIPQSAIVHTDTAQINKSDWQFLNEMCDLYGYGLTLHGTHIHIWDPWRATGRQISYHVLKSLKDVGHNPNPQPGVILSFSGTFSSHAATDRYATVLDAQGVVTDVSSVGSNDTSGLGRPYKTSFSKRIDVSAKSIQEAELAVSANVRNSIPFRATVEVLGLMGTYPGGLVRIQGFDSAFDVLWCVGGVKQCLGGVGMTTTLDLILDSTNEQSETIYNTQRFKTPPEPKYVKNRWMSTNRLINVYS